MLRETTYGVEAVRGFEPEIEGLDLPPATIGDETKNEIFSLNVEKTTKFQSFLPQRSRISPVKNDIRIVNGRKAILRKRVKISTRAATNIGNSETATSHPTAKTIVRQTRLSKIIQHIHSKPTRSSEIFLSHPQSLLT